MKSVDLERGFGKEAVLFSSKQLAVQSCIELLGARAGEIAVVSPITTDEETISAILRSGAQPVLLDIEPEHLQLHPGLLKELMDEAEIVPAVVIDLPCGQELHPELLEVVKDLPTVIISDRVPQNGETLVGSFRIYTFDSLIGTGAVVFHKYEDQIRELKLLRDGIFGHHAKLPDVLAPLIKHRWPKKFTHTNYSQLLTKAGLDDIILFSNIRGTDFAVKVPNARVMSVLINDDVEIACELGVNPLHRIEEFAERFVSDTPPFANAEKLENSILFLPTDDEGDTERQIVEILKETLNGEESE